MKKSLFIWAACCMASTIHAGELKSQVYGYVEGYVEQVEKSPVRSGGNETDEGDVTKEANAHEFDTPNVSLMIKSRKDKYSSFLNLNAS